MQYKIDTTDAQQAIQMAYACNIRGVANTMKQMVRNASELNQELGLDEREDVYRLLDIITDTRTEIYPVSLDPRIFHAIQELFLMAFITDFATDVMSYPPLVLATQVLLNIMSNNSWVVEVSNRPEGAIDHQAVKKLFMVNLYPRFENAYDLCERTISELENKVKE